MMTPYLSYCNRIEQKSWIVAVNTPLSDKISRHTLKACDGKELLDLCERIRTRVAGETKKRVEIVSCSVSVNFHLAISPK
jgi:hypothetical protein